MGRKPQANWLGISFCSGFLEYQWPKPGEDAPRPKLPYVAGFVARKDAAASLIKFNLGAEANRIVSGLVQATKAA